MINLPEQVFVAFPPLSDHQRHRPFLMLLQQAFE
jgi:hypothetical protein